MMMAIEALKVEIEKGSLQEIETFVLKIRINNIMGYEILENISWAIL